MKALIPLKGSSSRVTSKNTRNFAGSSLMCVKINQLKGMGIPVVVNSDSDHILSTAIQMGCEVIKREKFYATGDATTSEFYKNIAESFTDDIVLMCNATNPLIKDESIRRAIEIFKAGEYDSVNSGSLVHEFLVRDGKPFNYERDKQPGSQYLPDIYSLNFAVSIISRRDMIRYMNVLGDNPYIIGLSQEESLDIDTPFDFEIAEYLYAKRLQR